MLITRPRPNPGGPHPSKLPSTRLFFSKLSFLCFSPLSSQTITVSIDVLLLFSIVLGRHFVLFLRGYGPTPPVQTYFQASPPPPSKFENFFNKFKSLLTTLKKHPLQNPENLCGPLYLIISFFFLSWKMWSRALGHGCPVRCSFFIECWFPDFLRTFGISLLHSTTAWFFLRRV